MIAIKEIPKSGLVKKNWEENNTNWILMFTWYSLSGFSVCSHDSHVFYLQQVPFSFWEEKLFQYLSCVEAAI